MIEIRLEPRPQQTLSFQDEDRFFKITLRSALERMIIDITLNNEPLVAGLVIPENARVIPFNYLVPDFNFYLLTYNDETPDWTKFGATQKLYYERSV